MCESHFMLLEIDGLVNDQANKEKAGIFEIQRNSLEKGLFISSEISLSHLRSSTNETMITCTFNTQHWIVRAGLTIILFLLFFFSV